MLIGKSSDGRIIVAYESTVEAIQERSCLTCAKYTKITPCPLYYLCRAGKPAGERPYMYKIASDKVINSRLTDIGDSSGLKRI